MRGEDKYVAVGSVGLVFLMWLWVYTIIDFLGKEEWSCERFRCGGWWRNQVVIKRVSRLVCHSIKFRL